jgi:hypothetical protein
MPSESGEFALSHPGHTCGSQGAQNASDDLSCSAGADIADLLGPEWINVLGRFRIGQLPSLQVSLEILTRRLTPIRLDGLGKDIAPTKINLKELWGFSLTPTNPLEIPHFVESDAEMLSADYM